MLKRKTIILLTTLNTILIVTSAWGLVYQPGECNDVPDANWSGWPNSNFMAMINDNRHVASATVIAPNYIITAGHVYCASGVEGDKVRIGTENSYDYVIVDHRSEGGCSPNPDLAIYRIKKLEWIDPNDSNHPKEPDDANKSTYDMLKDADLDNWVSLYQVVDPNNKYPELGKIVFTGSYGPQRICEYVNTNAHIKANAGRLHWGINVISSCSSSALTIKYDRIQRGDYLKYEVCGGGLDSGAGWLIKDGNEWKIAGLYQGSTNGPRISSYNNWITDKIETMGGKLISPEDIDANEPLIFIPGQVQSTRQFVFQWRKHGRPCTWIIASFDKDDCMDDLSLGTNRIKVAGRLNSGQCYYGNSSIYVYTPKPFRWPWKHRKHFRR